MTQSIIEVLNKFNIKFELNGEEIKNIFKRIKLLKKK